MAEGGPVCIFRSPKFLLKFVQGTTPGVKKTWVDMLDHGSILKKTIWQYFLHQLANFDDQNVQLGFFQGTELIGKGFNMTWSEDHAKFKLIAAIFTSTNSIFIHIFIYNWHRWSMCQIWSPCTPISLRFDQGLPGNVISDVTRNDFGARYGFRPFFFNGRHENLIWAIFPLLIDIESQFWCLHLCFQGRKIEWNRL